MTRKKRNSAASLPLNGRPEGHTKWLQSFEGNEGIPAMLEQLAGQGLDVERIRTLLYAAPLMGSIKYRCDLDRLDDDLATVERHLDEAANLLEPFPFSPQQRTWTLGMLAYVRRQVEERRHCMAEWRSAFRTIQLTDLIITIIAKELERAGSRRVNEDLATLLTAAAVPGGTRDEVTNGWACDAATVHKRRDRLKRKPFAALGPYRRLFEKVNIEKLAQEYPALFIETSGKGRPERKGIGKTLAARTNLLPPLDGPAAEEAFWKGFEEAYWKGFRQEFPAPAGRDKKLPKQS